jgi:hypothetical protein
MEEVFKSFKDFDLDFHYQWNKQNISEWDDLMNNLKGHNARMIEKGREEGEQQMLLKMVKKLLNQNKTDIEICEFAEIELTKLQKIKQLLHLI